VRGIRWVAIPSTDAGQWLMDHVEMISVRKLTLYPRRLKSLFKLPVLYYNYRKGHTKVVGAYPDRLYIEATNLCNIDCIMCPTGLKMLRREKGFIRLDLFKKVIDEMAPHVKTTTLHIWGEPLLHPELIEMIRYAKKQKIRASISTNATLLHEDKSLALLDSGLDEIYLCLDGVKKETYEAIRRRADFEGTQRNIQRFIELKAKRQQQNPFVDIHPYVNVQIIEMAPTKAEVEEFTKLWMRPGVDKVNVKPFDAWANQVKEINQLRDQKPSVNLKNRYPCPLLWYHAHVYWDGTMTCCDRDYDAKYPLGNVAEKGVMAVWNGEKMAELRQKHLDNNLKDVPSCHKCTEWSWWRPGPFTARGNSPEPKG